MSIARTNETCILTLVVKVGVSDSGYNIYRNRTFNNVKSTVTDDVLHSLAIKLKDLQQYLVTDILRTDKAVLSI